jgi:hypothetical protein
MALRVSVTWPNPDSELLPESGVTIHLKKNGVVFTPKRSAPGLRVYDVSNGTTQVVLMASFSATLTKDGKTVTAEVLRIEQTYTVVGDSKLKADVVADYKGPHPLASVLGGAAGHGGVVIRLQTEFVNAEPFWAAFDDGWWPYYLDQKNREGKGTQMRVLGHTGGNPRIWFAMVPDSLASYTDGSQSCLVFYRPNNYSYSAVAGKHSAFAICRYFLTPKPDSDTTATIRERDHCDLAADHNLMRCRFEDSIIQSKRAVVLLHPWQTLSDYGVSVGPNLPSLCDKAIRYLWSLGLVCKGIGKVSLGRLGISAFSRGGLGLWPALAANSKRVDEVYAFDCNNTPNAAGGIIRWASSRDVVLRMVGGHYNITATNVIFKQVKESTTPKDPKTPPKYPLDRLTQFMTSPQYYDAGNNTVLDHYLKDTEEWRYGEDTQHQFTICGGEMRGDPKKAYDLNDVETYFLNFLNNSRFNKF